MNDVFIEYIDLDSFTKKMAVVIRPLDESFELVDDGTYFDRVRFEIVALSRNDVAIDATIENMRNALIELFRNPAGCQPDLDEVVIESGSIEREIEVIDSKNSRGYKLTIEILKTL
jgi:hypothetical protein